MAAVAARGILGLAAGFGGDGCKSGEPNLATHDPHFILDRDAGVAQNSPYFQIIGLRHASRARVTSVFERDFGGNIFQIPINERRRKLLAIDWIERASVSRIWPNRLVVRVWERTPIAFVNLTSGESGAPAWRGWR